MGGEERVKRERLRWKHEWKRRKLGETERDKGERMRERGREKKEEIETLRESERERN